MLPLADRNPTRRTPVITVLLILVNVGVFVLWQGGGSFGAKEDTKFAYEHAAVPCELVTGRPITAFEALAMGKERVTHERSIDLISLPQYRQPEASLIIPVHAHANLTRACLRSQ